MPRVPRSSFETSFFHVIIQGVNREYIFNKKEYIEAYLSLLDRYKKEYNISILAYCIMNNHAHLLIYTEEIQNMGKLMHKINGIYGQYYNKNENRVGIDMLVNCGLVNDVSQIIYNNIVRYLYL